MLPNPFSEEDGQRYIAEFKSSPSWFSPDQFVYAGFRSVATPSSANKVKCYGCNLTLDSVGSIPFPLQKHLEKSPACPIALAIQQRGLEIEEDAKQQAKDITNDLGSTRPAERDPPWKRTGSAVAATYISHIHQESNPS